MSFSNPHNQKYCSISMDEFKNGDFVICLPCKHIFNPTGITEWLKNNNTCPLCRTEVTNNDLTSEVFYNEPSITPPPVPKSKYVICTLCKKSKFRNNFKGHDKNFKCGNCRKKKESMYIVDAEINTVIAYSLLCY
jgi:hypothetical protein